MKKKSWFEKVGGKIEKDICLSQMVDTEAVLKMIVEVIRTYRSWGIKIVILL